MNFLIWLSHGFFNLPWWGYGLIALGLTHITILTVTIYLHRSQAHKALELHPSINHFFRFWLWLTTGMVTKEWAAVHRKHHAFSDKVGDPHSPHVYGIGKVLKTGVELYQDEAENKETINKYGNGTPDDWLERNLYTRHSLWGIYLMLAIDVTLFGVIGLTIWAIQMMWVPIFAAGVINGIGHWFGYRNFENSDKARNIVPWGIFIGGEELHNNHHTFATSAKLSAKWYEFDYGFMWIQIFAFFKLAKVKKTIPVIYQAKAPKLIPDLQTLETIITNRYSLAVNFSNFLKEECRDEIDKLKTSLRGSPSWKHLRMLLIKDKELLTNEESEAIKNICAKSTFFSKVFSLREDLSMLWSRSNLTTEQLLNSLQSWCNSAENSGIEKLRLFSLSLRSVSLH